LAFFNDVFGEIDKIPERADAFRYGEVDRFPLRTNQAMGLGPDSGPGPDHLAPAHGGTVRGDRLEPSARSDAVPAECPLGAIAGDTVSSTAERVADEVVRLLSGSMVRNWAGAARRVQPADIAILFRSRDSHREFERALERRGVPTYVYKGLGFFEAAEIQDAVALLRYLAEPLSDLRAAAFLRSRIVRLSDGAIAKLAPQLAAALVGSEPPAAVTELTEDDQRVLAELRRHIPRWLSWC
jgi:superfamily I DNA/RNA helicase